MSALPCPWDYLILTAADSRQGAAFESELALRRDLGRLSEVRSVRVVPDSGGRRIGSGASTLNCLREVLRAESGGAPLALDAAEAILRRLRILIVHAGGDARRLPAYSAAGKILLPLPGERDSALPPALFDRLVPQLLQFPPQSSGPGQVLVASGDALIGFDPGRWSADPGPGLTVLGLRASPQEAAGHGVFCPGPGGALRLYLQKPSLERQAAAGAIAHDGLSVLDLGLMSFDADTALQLLRAFCHPAESAGDGPLPWKPAAEDAIRVRGLDLYREICAAFGTEATLEHYRATVEAAGPAVDGRILEDWFRQLRSIPVRVEILERCRFLHFGTTRQLITSGCELAAGQAPASAAAGHIPLLLNSQAEPAAPACAAACWIENCRISAPLALAGENVLVALDVAQPLSLPRGACMDVSPGSDRRGQPCCFIRCHGVEDTFKQSLEGGATFCGLALSAWLELAGAAAADIWPTALAPSERTLWTARLFPAEPSAGAYRRWLWMFDAGRATPQEKAAFLSADRYSCAEIVRLTDVAALQARRLQNHLAGIEGDLPRLFSRASRFSARDLAFLLARHSAPAALFARLAAIAGAQAADTGDPLSGFTAARILHSLGTAVATLPREARQAFVLDAGAGLTSGSAAPRAAAAPATPDLAEGLHARAFETVTRVIVASSLYSGELPRNRLRPDERIWGRAPARIELGGGWTDTPPYTLEYGGHVANTAIDLNGQPPIHCYARVIAQPVIRLHSTDSGMHLEISRLEDLLDYRRPGDPFALAKAALAISGFSPAFAGWPESATLADMLGQFGGGLELTTVVGIPQGSGLGTSSILGAVVLAVIQRVIGRRRTPQELFHDVLRLEQALTTGGGWQDQIGGCVGGTKITATAPGLFPEPRVEPLPDDLLDPASNGGCTLLYYTGLTRLAKDILQEIVGAYLDREPRIMAALQEEHRVARAIADALLRRDLPAFGRYVDAAWELQKRLCGTVTNPEIESLLRRVRPRVHGMRISGAGSGGFLLMICRSAQDAAAVRELLERDPLNPHSRFFDYSINRAGLQVAAC
jgi:fucokinase